MLLNALITSGVAAATLTAGAVASQFTLDPAPQAPPVEARSAVESRTPSAPPVTESEPKVNWDVDWDLGWSE